MRKFNQKRASPHSTRDPIFAQSYPAQWYQNHRNTKKINPVLFGWRKYRPDHRRWRQQHRLLSSGKAHAGARQQSRSRDVMGVTREICQPPSTVCSVNGVVSGNVPNAVLPFAPVREIPPRPCAEWQREFIAWRSPSGHHFLRWLVWLLASCRCRVRYLTLTTNFQIMPVEGLQITADDQGPSELSMAPTLCKEMVWLVTKLYDHGSA